MNSTNDRSAPFYFAIAIALVITVHLLGISNLLSGPLLGLTTITLTTGISYLILLIFFLLFVFDDQRMKKRLERHTEIDFEKTHSFISLLLLVSLLFFIIVIQILGNAAILFDMLDSSTLTEIAETMASQITPIGYILNTIFVFFISFFGPLAYIGLTKNLNPKESLKVLKLKFEKRSLLYALLGVAAFGVFFESINALWILLQNIFGIELQENVVAVSMGSGLNLFSAFFISLLTAFGEELFFRGFLQNRAGVLITTIIFTLSHISYANVGEIVQVFIFSLIMGYGVKKTGNLGFAIGMHFINNFVTFIYILYFL